MKVTPENTRWKLLQRVLDEGYSREYPMKVTPESTRWRLLQRCVLYTKLDNYVFIAMSHTTLSAHAPFILYIWFIRS